MRKTELETTFFFFFNAAEAFVFSETLWSSALGMLPVPVESPAEGTSFLKKTHVGRMKRVRGLSTGEEGD